MVNLSGTVTEPSSAEFHRKNLQNDVSSIFVPGGFQFVLQNTGIFRSRIGVCTSGFAERQANLFRQGQSGMAVSF